MGTRLNCLREAVLTSIHNLCFGSKIRKMVYPCIPQFYSIMVGVDFWMLDRSSKMINGGGRVLVLHAQHMKMVSYVQPVVRELYDSYKDMHLTAGYT